MNNTVFVMVSISIAAIIGYVTNYLAIKMLFHPRRVWKIGGRRVPFTPGLIPKRKSEIAAALGRVVSEYLVTADGLRNMLRQPELRGRMEHKLRQYIEEWAEKDETLSHIAVRFMGSNAADSLRTSVEIQAGQWIEKGARGLWNTEAMRRPLLETLDHYQIPLIELVERDGTRWILEALREELSSPHGARIIRKLVTQMLDGVGGMMGMLAGMFVDEDKIAVKVRTALMQYLNSQAAHDAVADLLRKQAERIGVQTPAELLRGLRTMIERHGRGDAVAVRQGQGGEGATESLKVQEDEVANESRSVQEEEGADNPQSDEEWFAALAVRSLPWRSWLDRIWELTPSMLLSEHKEWFQAKVPDVSDRLITAIADNVERLVHAVNLPKLVQEQVENFPTEQLETVLLSITGREFKAITWLGALLGGLIGTFQALLYIGLG